MTYSTRLNGLKVLLDTGDMLGETSKVIFRWEPYIVLPLQDKDKYKIEKNCKHYLSGSYINKLYPKTQEEKRSQVAPPTKDKYISIERALKGEF